MISRGPYTRFPGNRPPMNGLSPVARGPVGAAIHAIVLPALHCHSWRPWTLARGDVFAGRTRHDSLPAAAFAETSAFWRTDNLVQLFETEFSLWGGHDHGRHQQARRRPILPIDVQLRRRCSVGTRMLSCKPPGLHRSSSNHERSSDLATGPRLRRPSGECSSHTHQRAALHYLQRAVPGLPLLLQYDCRQDCPRPRGWPPHWPRYLAVQSTTTALGQRALGGLGIGICNGSHGGVTP